MNPGQIRVLVVEDERTWQEDIAGAFKALGCLVDVVDNSEDALRHLNDYTYHLITIDNMLKESGEFDSHAGLRLADMLHKNGLLHTNYQAIESAVITSLNDDVIIVRDMLKRHDVRYYFHKEIDYTDEVKPGGTLHELIERLRNPPIVEIDARTPGEHLAGIKVDWETYWPEPEVLPVSQDDLPPPPDDVLAARINAEFQLLFQRLFPKIDSITLKPMLRGYSATQVFESHYLMNGVEFPAVIVKVGSFYKIAQEYNNFLEYVSTRIKNTGITVTLEGSSRGFARTQMLGGLVYTFVGSTPDEFPEFGTFYRDMDYDDFEKIERVLNHLFDVTCAFWYQPQVQEQQRVSLYRIYDEMLNLSKYAELVQTAVDDLEHTGVIAATSESVRLMFTDDEPAMYPNAIAALLVQPELRRTVRLGLSHGDLNENNIRVNPVAFYAWLIDFQRTGQHHALRDFIQLEMVIKLILLDIGDIRDYYAMEQVLLSSHRFDTNSLNQLRGSYNAPNKTYRKAFDTVLRIRQIAANKVPSLNQYEDYFVGLMLYTYNGLRLFKEAEGKEIAQGQNALQQLAALVSTCMLAEKIKIF